MSKKIFNFNDYKGGCYAMHCKTEEEAKDFCRVMHEAGKVWNNGKSYVRNTEWFDYAERTCYNFNNNLKCDIKWYRREGYTILEWSDFMNKEFTKDDLKNFDIILRRDGDVRIRIGNRYIDKDGYSNLNDNYSSDMTSVMGSHQDIMAVIRPVTLEDMSFDAFEKKLGRLVYERDETVEMTLEEVCKALGKNVKIVKEAKS